jgi:hypothetical protein
MSVMPSSMLSFWPCMIRSRTSLIRTLAFCRSTSIHRLGIGGIAELAKALDSASTPWEMIIEGGLRKVGWDRILSSLSSGETSDLVRRDGFLVDDKLLMPGRLVGEVCNWQGRLARGLTAVWMRSVVGLGYRSSLLTE